MGYVKKVVCLANSTKFGGLCFAGKEVFDQGYGGWIRPVSARDDEEISTTEQTFSGGGCPELLDVVEIPMLTPKPTGHQQENHLIDGSKKWKKVGRVAPGELSALRDDVPGPLWVDNGNNNDRVSVADAHNLDNSLLLVKPTNLSIVVQWKDTKMQVRANFHHNGNSYNMVVTDPVAEEKYTQMAKADYRQDNARTLPREYETPDGVYLCVSLAEQTFYGKLYKLVAAIIGDND